MRRLILEGWISLDGFAVDFWASLHRVNLRTYDTGVVFLHDEPRR